MHVNITHAVSYPNECTCMPTSVYIYVQCTPSLTHRMEWCCSHCGTPYNRDLIEQSLLDTVQKRSMSFVLQDLVCTKCRGVSTHCCYMSLVTHACTCTPSFNLYIITCTIIKGRKGHCLILCLASFMAII